MRLVKLGQNSLIGNEHRLLGRVQSPPTDIGAETKFPSLHKACQSRIAKNI